jgi:hypothetical protein
VKIANPASFSIDAANMLFTSGWADGEFFNAEMMNPSVDSVAGTDGEVAISNQYDERWKVVIKLLQTSDLNAVLEQLWNLKRHSQGTVGMFPFVARHADTKEMLAATEACVVKPPVITQDRLATVREWELLLCNGKLTYSL